MFASYKPGTSALRTLSADDTAGICEIYPTAATRNVDTVVASSGTEAADACDPTPRHGFGSTCASNPAPASSSSSGGCAVSAAVSRAGDDGKGASALLLVAVGAAVVSGRRRRKSHETM
jgi:hypothetical protein